MKNDRRPGRRRARRERKAGRGQLGLDWVGAGETHTCSAHAMAHGRVASKDLLKVSITGTYDIHVGL